MAERQQGPNPLALTRYMITHRVGVEGARNAYNAAEKTLVTQLDLIDRAFEGEEGYNIRVGTTTIQHGDLTVPWIALKRQFDLGLTLESVDRTSADHLLGLFLAPQLDAIAAHPGFNIYKQDTADPGEEDDYITLGEIYPSGGVEVQVITNSDKSRTYRYTRTESSDGEITYTLTFSQLHEDQEVREELSYALVAQRDHDNIVPTALYRKPKGPTDTGKNAVFFGLRDGLNRTISVSPSKIAEIFMHGEPSPTLRRRGRRTSAA